MRMNAMPDSKHESDRDALLELNARFNKLLTEGRSLELVDLFDADVVDMAPGVPTSVGKEAVGDRLKWLAERYRVEAKGEVKQAEASGNLGFVRAESEGGWFPKDGSPPMRFAGKWLQIWKRQPDGKWRLLQNIWNRDD